MYFYQIFIPSKFVPLRMNVPNIYQPEKSLTCFIQQGLVLLSAEPKWGLYSLSLWAPTELPLQGDQQFSDSAGILLKCTVWPFGARMEAEITHPKHTQVVSLLLACGPHVGQQEKEQALTGTRSVWCLKHLPPVRMLLSENRETEDN